MRPPNLPLDHIQIKVRPALLLLVSTTISKSKTISQHKGDTFYDIFLKIQVFGYVFKIYILIYLAEIIPYQVEIFMLPRKSDF